MGHRRLKSCINVTVCILNIRFRNNHSAYLHLQKTPYMAGQQTRDTDLMLSHRLRSWNNTKPILCQWLVFARVSGTL